jgi:hypothetical protein
MLLRGEAVFAKYLIMAMLLSKLFMRCGETREIKIGLTFAVTINSTLLCLISWEERRSNGAFSSYHHINLDNILLLGLRNIPLSQKPRETFIRNTYSVC